MSSNKSLLLLSIIFSAIFISESLVCPDTSVCTDGMTCCKWSSGKYGCCPLESAQCCSDGLHCCPSKTKCNDKEGTCDQIQIPLKKTHTKKHRLLNYISIVENIVCPGGEYQCPDGDTCCQMSGGEWGCCPLAGAVCCSDEIHCCPAGTTCGPEGCQRISSLK